MIYCEFIHCTFNRKGKCAFKNISISPEGMCEICNVPDYSEKIVLQYKRQMLQQLEAKLDAEDE